MRQINTCRHCSLCWGYNSKQTGKCLPSWGTNTGVHSMSNTFRGKEAAWAHGEGRERGFLLYAGWFQKTLGEAIWTKIWRKEGRLTEMQGEETADAKALRLKNIGPIWQKAWRPAWIETSDWEKGVRGHIAVLINWGKVRVEAGRSGRDYCSRPWCWERLTAEGEGGDRGWKGWMVSLTQWTWVWASSRRWWRTGKPGVQQSTGLQIVGYDFLTEQQDKRW